MNESSSSEVDDILSLHTALQDNTVQFSNQLDQWKDKYSDVINNQPDWLLEPSKSSDWLDSPSKPPAEPMSIPHASTHPMRRNVSESSLRRRRRKLSTREDSYFDLSSSRNLSYASLASSALDEEYFAGCEEEELTLVEELAENLQINKEQVDIKINEMNDVMKMLQDENDENTRLHDRFATAHRSLTMLELRQEKIIRDALHDNLSANKTLRELQDEIVDLRMREAQNLKDLHKLNKENSQLKLKVMELRMGSLKPPLPQQKQPKKNPRLQNKKKAVQTPRQRPPSPGLMDLEGLDTSPGQLQATNIVHRGTMGSFQRAKPHNKNSYGKKIPAIKTPEKSLSQVLTESKKSKLCPLCKSPSSESKNKNVKKLTPKKSFTKSTSTKDIENVVAIRTSINLFGIVIPIPMFLYMLLRVLERLYQMFVTWLKHGPFHNVNFPYNLKISAMKVLRDVRARFHFNPMYS